MIATLRATNLGIRFVLELCMLGALAYWGFQSGNGALRHVFLGIGAPLLAAVFWGLFLSPKAKFRLNALIKLGLEIIVFALATLALVVSGQPMLALVFALLAIVSRGVLMLLPQ